MRAHSEQCARPCLFVQATLTDDPSWQKIESALFCLRAAGELVPGDEIEHTPQVFQALALLPEHPSVLQTAMLVVGAHAEWLAREDGDASTKRACLELALPFLFRGLAVPSLTAQAAQALDDVCTECDEALVEWLEPVSTLVLRATIWTR